LSGLGRGLTGPPLAGGTTNGVGAGISPSQQESAPLTVHEMSIVQALIDQVGAEVEQSGHRGRVVSLEVHVGRLSGVHVDALRFGFEMLAPGTLLEGAELRITQPEALLCCRACGLRQSLPELVMRCPVCHSEAITIEGGQDLILQTIELEDD
jgi:hydrogenase nickel incorporation protein HypA/HybF